MDNLDNLTFLDNKLRLLLLIHFLLPTTPFGCIHLARNLSLNSVLYWLQGKYFDCLSSGLIWFVCCWSGSHLHFEKNLIELSQIWLADNAKMANLQLVWLKWNPVEQRHTPPGGLHSHRHWALFQLINGARILSCIRCRRKQSILACAGQMHRHSSIR